MSLTRRHFAALALALALGCIDRPVEPTSESGALTVHPILPANSSMASFNLVIDSVYVEIYIYDTTGCAQCEVAGFRPGGAEAIAALGRLDTLLVAQSFYWAPNAQSLPLRFELPVIPPGHLIQLYLSMSAGGQPLFYGYADLDPFRGTHRLPPIDVYYFGPGYNADSIAITPGDTSARLTDTLQFSAQAFATSVPFDTAYIGWRTTDTTRARITYTGRLTFRAAMAGATVGVVGLVPNGVADTVWVTVPLPAASILRVSGDSQTAPGLTLLSSPITVQVRNASNLPERGVLVRFAPLGATGTTVTDSLVFTDSLGHASTGVVLGSAVGGVNVEARVAANTAIKTSFHATIDPVLPAPILFVTDSFGSNAMLRQVLANGSSRATIVGISTASNSQAYPRWAPGWKRIAYSDYLGNFVGLSLADPAGDSTAIYVDDTPAYRPRFNANGLFVAFQCGSFPDDDQNGNVCVGSGVAGPLSLLSGAGDNGLRVLLTDKVPTRPIYGPASYAWNPANATQIAIVRDSIADTTFISHSAIYRTDPTGSAPVLLTAYSIDLGGGPLKIVGPMDWSPNGATIAFAATDQTDQASALYLLTVASGVVTRLTTPVPGQFGAYGDRVPVFSPDGSEILFLRIIYSGDGMNADFNVVTLAGGSVRQVGDESSGWNSSDPYSLSADWSPDGQTLLLAGMVTFYQTIYLVPASTSTQAEYLAGRVLIGDANGGNSVTDQGANWRP